MCVYKQVTCRDEVSFILRLITMTFCLLCACDEVEVVEKEEEGEGERAVPR